MNSVIALTLLGVIFCSTCQANPLSRIVNGQEAENFQFPWHVSLTITLLHTTAKSYCGGSLISSIFVVTAAESYTCGFGVLTPNSVHMSGVLNYAEMIIISNAQCRLSYDYRLIPDSVMCAVGINGSIQTTCYGDHGGGLVSHIDGTWVLIGIISIMHEPPVCSGTTPVGFTRTTSNLEWISSVTGIELRP